TKAALTLAQKTELLIYVQLAKAEDVEKARRAADAAGLYGRRVYIEQGDLKSIHLANNLSDEIIARGSAADAVAGTEGLSVVKPFGKVTLGEKTIVKPWPAGREDWSHPYHGPDNNPYSRDRAAAPFLTQFLSGPRNAPIPQLTVTAAGRVFRLYGHMGLRGNTIGLVNKLVGMNGFNGVVLWEYPLKAGFMTHRSTLIASPKTVFLADDTSCKLLDAESGKVSGEIILPAESADGPVWKWLALEGNVLYALLGAKEEG